jgi:hypothetical protein
MADKVDRFTAALAAFFDSSSESHEKNVGSLKTYFGLGECPAFDGAFFESYAITSTSPDRIEAADLVAVTLLSMEIRRQSGSGISTSNVLALEQRWETISLLLGGIPTDRDLHDLSGAEYEELVSDQSLGTRLWRLLRDEVGMHRVATFKLLARKRPRLFPIADSRTEGTLGRQDNWWHAWHHALSTRPDIVDELRRIRDEVGEAHAPAREVSLLRVADIALWEPRCE